MKKILSLICAFLLLSVQAQGAFWIVVEQKAASSSVTLAYESYADAADTSVAALPTGVTDGDMLVMCLSGDEAESSWTHPAGWVEIPVGGEISSSATTTTFWKVADSESGTQDFTNPNGRGIMVRFSKSGGAWSTPTSRSANGGGLPITSIATGNMTVASGDIVAVCWGTGDNAAVSDSDSMTEISNITTGSLYGYAFYQTGLSGTVSKTITSVSSNEIGIVGLVLHAE